MTCICVIFFTSFNFKENMKTKNFLYINTFSYHIHFITSLIILIYKPKHFKFYRYLSIIILPINLNSYTNKVYKNTLNLQKNHATMTKSHNHVILGIISFSTYTL